MPPPVVVIDSSNRAFETTSRANDAAGALPISGSWSLEKTVENYTYGPYHGLRYVYRIKLLEGRDGVESGSGELWAEIGEQVRGLNHAIMSLSGHRHADELRMTFQLAGRKRP